MSIEAGRYFSLTPVGSRIWQLIESPATAGDVVTALEREFEIDEERCRAETFTFLEGLVVRGLALVENR
jgi:hypothetical protein